jgi:hypothetical protein
MMLPDSVLVRVKGTTAELEALQTLMGCPVAVTSTSGWASTVMGTLLETVALQLSVEGVPADVTVRSMLKDDVGKVLVLVHLTLKVVPEGLAETAKAGQEHAQCCQVAQDTATGNLLSPAGKVDGALSLWGCQRTGRSWLPASLFGYSCDHDIFAGKV